MSKNIERKRKKKIIKIRHTDISRFNSVYVKFYTYIQEEKSRVVLKRFQKKNP
jgi:hypothetical protein